MEPFNAVVIYGLINSLILTFVVLLSLFKNPRIWMSHLPPEVQRILPPKTATEKRQSLIVLILFLNIFLIIPACALANIYPPITFLEAFSTTYSISFMFNLTDLLFLDWIVICTITPSFIRVKGVDRQVYKNYRKHLMDFFKGAVVIFIPSLCSALLGLVLSNIKHAH